MIHKLLLVLVLGCVIPLHLSSPLPNGEQMQQSVSDDVKDLENLRNENSKPANNSDTIPSAVEDVQHEESQPLPTPLPSTEEEPQANSRSAIFRHRGIAEAKKSAYWNQNQKSQQLMQPMQPMQPIQPSSGYRKFAGIQYSPNDLAAYVFTTGDEEGVAVAVEELVREGMMGRTDAINYLQDVKQTLAYLENQYENQKKLEEFKSRMYAKPQLPQRILTPPREQYISDIDNSKRESKMVEAPAPIITTEHPQQVVIASTSEPKAPSVTASTTTRPKTDAVAKAEPEQEAAFKEDDLKRRLPPRNSNGFTMEVIYKLAKYMFMQSIMRDDPTAEETLTGLVSFLESEVGNKRISPEMKEKVLEIVSAALVDSLREYQGLLSESQAPMYEESGIYQHMADNRGPLISKVPLSEIYRKIAAQGQDNMLEAASKNRPNSS